MDCQAIYRKWKEKDAEQQLKSRQTTSELFEDIVVPVLMFLGSVGMWIAYIMNFNQFEPNVILVFMLGVTGFVILSGLFIIGVIVYLFFTAIFRAICSKIKKA